MEQSQLKHGESRARTGLTRSAAHRRQVDVAIVANASGARKLGPAVVAGLKRVANPLKLARSPDFLLVWALYAGTYAVANLTSTAMRKQPAEATATARLVATSAFNLPMCVYKDNQLAKWNGVGKPRAVPKLTLGLFGARDALTMLASFTLVEPTAAMLHRNGLVDDHRKTVYGLQLTLPLAIQTLSTPLQLYGLGTPAPQRLPLPLPCMHSLACSLRWPATDIYNRPNATLAQRATFMRSEYAKSLAARCARIAIAFSFGGVANRKAREVLNRK